MSVDLIHENIFDFINITTKLKSKIDSIIRYPEFHTPNITNCVCTSDGYAHKAQMQQRLSLVQI